MSLTLLLSNKLDTKFAEIDHFMWRRKSQSVTISIVYNSCHLLIIQFSIAKHKVEYIVKGKRNFVCLCWHSIESNGLCANERKFVSQRGAWPTHRLFSIFSGQLCLYTAILHTFVGICPRLGKLRAQGKRTQPHLDQAQTLAGGISRPERLRWDESC